MDLNAQGRALLKAMGGSLSQLKSTPAAQSRWGIDRPDSVINLLPEELATLCLALPYDIMRLSDSALEKSAEVTRLDRRIRLRFWDEYEKAAGDRRLIDLHGVIANSGIPSWDAYEGRLRETPALLAWLMNPPAEYKLQMREAQELGLRRLTDILELPLLDPATNKVNTGVGLLILQAIKLIDARLHGAPTTKNVNVNVDAGQAPPNSTLSMDEVDKKIKELEARLGGPASVPSLGTAPPGASSGPSLPHTPAAIAAEKGTLDDALDILDAEFSPVGGGDSDGT